MSLGDKQMSLSISEAFAYGGRLEASLEVRRSKAEADQMSGHLRAKANGILAGTFAREMVGRDFVTGTALAEIDLQGEGQQLGQIAKSANGDLSLVVTDGGLSNFNLDSMQNALETDGGVEPDALYEGGSSFDVLSIRGRIAEEKLQIDGLRVTSGKRALLGKAELNLLDMVLDFPGTMALYRSNDPTTHSTEEPIKKYDFYLKGPIAQPLLTLHKAGDAPVSDTKDILVPGVPVDLGTAAQTDNKKATPAPASTQLEALPAAVDNPPQKEQQGGVAPTIAVSDKNTPSDLAPLPGEGGLKQPKTFGEAAEELFLQSDPSQGVTQP